MNSFSYIFLLVLITTTLQTVDSRRTKPREVRDRDRDRQTGRGDSKTPEVDSMICPTCDRLFCTVRKASKLKCKGGKTTDICGCCPVCAKQIGEPCGGEWNYLGKCDVGLYCKASTISLITPTLYQHIQTEVPRSGIAEGTCLKIEILDDPPGSKSTGDVQKPRSSYQPKCEPKCTPDYCLRNPRSICSAVDVVDMKRDCHGSCQHTSCQACSWVDPDPDCGACSSEDFSCIKRFAKCIKRSYCTRSKFPCKSIAKEDHVGKFQCMVPKCLDKS